MAIALTALVAFTSLVPSTGRQELRSETASSTGGVSGGGTSAAPIGAGAGTPGAPGTVDSTGATIPGAVAAGGGSGTSVPGAAVATGCPDRVLQVPGDTYSPPCISFAGDNGGATAKGVTAETIKVAWRLTTDAATAGAVQAAVGSGVDITDTPEDIRRTVEAIAEYFSSRYQMYGRTLDVDIFDGRGSGADELLGGGQDGANADGVTVANQIGAFVDASANSAPYSDALARRGVIAVGMDYLSEEWYAERHPYVWSGVSCTQAFRQLADYANKRLFGGTADHAGADLKGRPRKIAVISPENSFYQDCVRTFRADLQAQGNDVVDNLTYALDINTVSQDTSAIIARLAEAQVTSVICFTDPVSPLFYTAKATQQRYFPEWIVAGVALTDADIAGQQYDQQQWQHAFGIRTLTENVPRRQSVAYAAYKAMRPDQEPAGAALLGIYTRFLQVAQAIQAAGPNLTPETFGAGWQRYPGGTGQVGTWRGSPDSHALQIDAQEVYWDVDGTSTYNGLAGTYVATSPRYELGQWPAGRPAVFP